MVRAAATGGAITIYTKATEQDWYFYRHVSDMTPSLLDEPPMSFTSDTTSNWSGVLTLLDRYRWPKLTPVLVHPEFWRETWDAIESRLEADGRVSSVRQFEWQEICGIQSPTI